MKKWQKMFLKIIKIACSLIEIKKPVFQILFIRLNNQLINDDADESRTNVNIDGNYYNKQSSIEKICYAIFN